MLDEIINYVQSLQRQVEVNQSWPISISNDGHNNNVLDFLLIKNSFFAVAVSVYEVGFC